MAVMPSPRLLTVRQKYLVAKFKPLAHRLGRMYANQVSGDANEFEAEALHALCRAALAFDPNRGIKFVTYAWRTIQWRLWQWCERQKRRLPMAPQEDAEHAYEIPDRRPSAETIIEHRELMEIVRSTLTRRERVMLLAVHFDGLTLREIGVKVGLSYEKVRRMNIESCRKLQKRLR
jgi:RNA polymerase sigma factor (sigma-70 family)